MTFDGERAKRPESSAERRARIAREERLAEALRPLARLYEAMSEERRKKLDNPIAVVGLMHPNTAVLRVCHARDAWMLLGGKES